MATNETHLSFYVVIFRSICNLYNWRYKKLGNLSHVERMPEYQLANAGFTFDFQLINVEDFEGAGETELRPFFYQVLFSY